MTSKKNSLDAMSKQHAFDEAAEAARTHLGLETLATRNRDALDFHDTSVASIRRVIEMAFEAGYREGLHTGYRQGRGDACAEAAGSDAPTSPRNPQLPA
jgi:hypothetical protein